jgi:hypothetical protein
VDGAVDAGTGEGAAAWTELLGAAGVPPVVDPQAATDRVVAPMAAITAYRVTRDCIVVDITPPSAADLGVGSD